MKIIGHRGAAGLALENTLPSLELARLLGVDAIEFDVRKTKDDKLVLCHDADLADVSPVNVKLRELNLKRLKQIVLNDEESRTPTLEEALRITGDTPVMIEIKEPDCIQPLLKTLDKFPDKEVTILSFRLDELALLRSLRPDLRLYGNENNNPLDIIQFARKLKLDGIGLNFWLLNPLTYFLARRYKLDIFVFTVNNKFLGNFLSLLYPKAAICTNHPEFFIKHPYLRLRNERLQSQTLLKKKTRRKKSHKKRSRR